MYLDFHFPLSPVFLILDMFTPCTVASAKLALEFLQLMTPTSLAFVSNGDNSEWPLLMPQDAGFLPRAPLLPAAWQS